MALDDFVWVIGSADGRPTARLREPQLAPPQPGWRYPAGCAVDEWGVFGPSSGPVERKDAFALALGFAGTPWKVVEIRFDGDLKRLNIEVDFPPGSRFPHPGSGEACAVYDSERHSWRHLNFFRF